MGGFDLRTRMLGPDEEPWGAPVVGDDQVRREAGELMKNDCGTLRKRGRADKVKGSLPVRSAKEVFGGCRAGGGCDHDRGIRFDDGMITWIIPVTRLRILFDHPLRLSMLAYRKNCSLIKTTTFS